MTSNRAEEYRRLARECLEIAHTLPAGERRATLLQMAQVWQRRAEQQDEAPALPVQRNLARSQQQQQVQPKDDDKKE